jgi:oligopeptide transport system substrate-binding protein
MERAADPETASTVADAYLGDIVGVRDKIRGRADEIEGVRVIDDQTLELTIDAPRSYFLAKLTYPTAYVVDEQQVESNPRNWTRKPNGTGPFKMQEWRLGERITLEANDRYHLGAPDLEQVTFLLAGGSVLTMYENGEIDFSSVSIRDIDRVLDPSDPLHEDYVTGDELSVFYLGFNTETAPFDDPNVRQAFAHAIDRETITRVVLRDMLPVADGIVPPGVPGYTSDVQALDYDPEQARQLLEESTYGGPDDLPDITLTEVGGGATVGLDTQAMIEMWKESLDVTVEIEQTDAATFFADLDAGRHQLFASGWVMDYPDPQNIIDILFYSTSRQNNARYSNPEIDALIEEARTEQDQEAQFDLYRQAEEIIVEDAAWIPLYFGRDHALVKPYVQGLSVAPMVIPRLRYVSVER